MRDNESPQVEVGDQRVVPSKTGNVRMLWTLGQSGDGGWRVGGGAFTKTTMAWLVPWVVADLEPRLLP